MASYIDKIARLFGIKQQEEESKDTKFDVVKHYRILGEKETTQLINQIRIPNKSVSLSDDIPKLLEPLTKGLQSKRLDNEKLIALAPEIDQAAAILIPSILSPNDMRTTQFYINIDNEQEDSGTISKINDVLMTTFKDELGINTKLFHWLNTTMFRHGAKPLLILPSYVLNTIDQLTRVPDQSEKAASIESLCYKIDTDIDTNEFQAALEGISDEPINNPVTSKLEDPFDGDGAIEFTKELQVLGFKDSKMAAAQEMMSDNLNASLESAYNNSKPPGDDGKSYSGTRRYTAPFINISDIIGSKGEDTFSQPSILELPYESTIPIIIEGAPDNHIGYFIIMNDQGVPISADTHKGDDPEIHYKDTPTGSKRIDDLYKAFYGSGYTHQQRKASDGLKTSIVESVYSKYLDKVMAKGLDSVGLGDFNIKLSGDTIQVMFTRLLRQTKTKALFVPADYLVYLAFEYNENGTGKSKIDNIKFPLSLKMTLIITRLMALIESSINRRKLEITFDDTIANPIETLQQIKKELMKKKMHGISYDPNTIISSSIDKELTVVPNNIPGVENFSISDESNNVDYPRPDSDLMEEINNMYTLSLGVSPQSLSRFKEDELAISVATNNLFMSNQIVLAQTVVSDAMTKLLKVYISCSTHLKGNIAEILENSEIDDDGGDSSKMTSRLTNLINSITFSLPKPNIAFDKSQYENVREFTSLIDEILNTMLSGDLMDRDTEDDIKRLRAYTKRSILGDYLDKNTAFGSTFADDVFKDTPIVGITDMSQTIMNFSKALKDMKEKFSGEGGDSGGGGYGY